MGETEVVEDYGDGTQIVRERDEDGHEWYHFESPLERMQTFENPHNARIYADVYEAMGGFREEKTGERGVPPSVARARHDVLVSYLACQPSMSVTWAARHFGIDEQEVKQYITMVRERAEASREDN
jgi:hypothetical protein